MAPKCMRAEQHVSERVSIAPTKDEKMTETKPSVSPPDVTDVTGVTETKPYVRRMVRGVEGRRRRCAGGAGHQGCGTAMGGTVEGSAMA